MWCCSNIFWVPYSWRLFQISARSLPSIFADFCVLGSLKIQRCLISSQYSACNHILTIQSPLRRVHGRGSSGVQKKSPPLGRLEREKGSLRNAAAIKKYSNLNSRRFYADWFSMSMSRARVSQVIVRTNPCNKIIPFCLNKTLYRNVKLTVSLLNNCLKFFVPVLVCYLNQWKSWTMVQAAITWKI